MEKNKLYWVCSECSSRDVEVQGWVDVNSGKVISEDEYYYCNTCETNPKTLCKSEISIERVNNE